MNDLKYLGYCFAAATTGVAISGVLVLLIVILKSFS